MKNHFAISLFLTITGLTGAQTVVVNPNGTHTTVINSGETGVAIQQNGTLSPAIVSGNAVVVINPDGTHSVGHTTPAMIKSRQSAKIAFDFTPDTLRLKWTSDTLFQKPESALYDKQEGIIYISNINGKYLARDGNGFISRLKTDGTIEKLKWLDGLNNPQGMGLFQKKLYVADINRIVRIDIPTATIDKTWNIPEAVFLNDITTDSNGDVYVSECRKNKIYRLHNERVEIWLEDSVLASPNGLLCERNKLMLLNMKDGKIFAINKQTKKIEEFSNGIRNADGIVSDGHDGYFVTGAWQGEVFYIDCNGQKKLLLDLGKEKIITADICYIASRRLLIIPTLDKRILACKVL